MKCENCGANISRKALKCPYCGWDNPVAVRDRKIIDSLHKKNLQKKHRIIKKSWPDIVYKIVKRVNISAAVLVLVLAVVSGFVSGAFHIFGRNGEYEVMKTYYDNDDFVSLVQYMDIYKLYDSENNFEISQMALLYNMYENFQEDFSNAYEKYVNTGFYDSYNLKSTVKNGIDIILAYPSYLYEETTANNLKKFRPYQEKVKMVLTGILKIPEEMLTDISYYDFDKYNQIEDYVLEVLPNEE